MKVLQNFSSNVQHQFQCLSPFATRVKPRTRSDVTIWSLPEELQLLLLRELHVKDLLSMKAVHSHFNELINSNSILWSNVNFYDTWPNSSNIRHFEKAAEAGNVEALLKLGVAYLYSEGLPESVGGELMTINGDRAAAMFCEAELLTPNVSSFTWLFIRPPWSLNGACCKEYVFNKMKKSCLQDENNSVLSCVVQILLLLGDEQQKEAITYLERASSCKCLDTAYLLWEHKRKSMVLDKAGQLECIRCLRDIASFGHTEARLALCNSYAAGALGGISAELAASTVREFVQSSKALQLSNVFRRSSELTHSMRYILVDWLVEVAGMKDFSSLTLHTAISVVDRFLLCHPVPRTKLQLLGVAAMVLCSRLINKDIITIREAAWLTDNTYKYEDVVRMMGEIISVLKGKIRVPTILDYVKLFCELSSCNAKTQHLSEYLCEMSLLELTVVDSFSFSQIAASCVLLARLTLSYEPWPDVMCQFTGYNLHALMDCCVLLHGRCYVVGPMVDHRDVKLQAVKTRYSDEKFNSVAEVQGVEKKVLTQLFGMEFSCDYVNRSWGRMNTKHLIMSPSSRMKHHDRSDGVADRELAGTPTLECNDLLNDSFMSGYDGDKEDADETVMDFEDEDPDLSSLWCNDRHDNNLPSYSFMEDSGIKTGSTSTKSSSDKLSMTSFVTKRTRHRSHIDSDVFASDDNSQDNERCIDNMANTSLFTFCASPSQGSARTRVTRQSSSRQSPVPSTSSSNAVSEAKVKRKSTSEIGNDNKIYVKSS